MAKTRRQRALEHPGKPKAGVRDPKRKPKTKNDAAVMLGRLGGKAPHEVRGLQALPAAKRRELALSREAAKREKKEAVG